MPRRDDIPAAFRKSIIIEPGGRRIVRTRDFVCEQANLWIEDYQHSFSDISTDTVRYELFGEVGIGRLERGGLVTADGKRVDGAVLENMIVLGSI